MKTSKSAQICTCTCCGADITAPQFFNGKAYGYTCIKKVSDQKRIKDKSVWVKADSVEEIDQGMAVDVIATINGVKYSQRLFKGVNGELSYNQINGGLVQVVNKLRKPIFKGIVASFDPYTKVLTIKDRKGDIIYIGK